MAIDVDEDLGGIGDRPRGVEGMDIPEEGEVSQAAMVQYVRADQHEEVAEHSIAGPIHSEVRQTIEEVVGAWPGFFDDALELTYQGLEPLSELKRVGFYTWEIRSQWTMLGETEVDEAYAGSLGEITVGLHEWQVFLDGVDLPYDIVSRDHATQDVCRDREPRSELWSVVRHDVSRSMWKAGNVPFQRMPVSGRPEIAVIEAACSGGRRPPGREASRISGTGWTARGFPRRSETSAPPRASETSRTAAADVSGESWRRRTPER